MTKYENAKMDLVNSEAVIIEGPVVAEDDDKVRVYGSTGVASPAHPKIRPNDHLEVWHEIRTL